MKKLSAILLCGWASVASAQTVNPPIIPPGGGASIFTNNTWTGTNTFNNTVTFNGAINGLTAAKLPGSAASIGAITTIATPQQYGAICNGNAANAAADTTGVQSAINSANWTIISGACMINGTLTITASNTRISGVSMAGGSLNFQGSGGQDGFLIGTNPDPSVCIGTTVPVACRQIGTVTLENLGVYATSRTGGYLFDLNGAANVIVSNINYFGWDLIKTQYVNNVTFEKFNGYANDTGSSVIYNYNAITTGTTTGDKWYRSDVINYNNVVLNAQNKGSTCHTVDGMVHTVRPNTMGLIACTYGVVYQNTAGSSSYYPQFYVAHDLEVDGGTNSAFTINGGNGFIIEGSQLDNTGSNAGTPANTVNIFPDTGASETRGIEISNTEIHGTWAETAFIDARNVTITNSQFYDANHAGTAGRPSIEVGAHADNVTINSSIIGPRLGDPNTTAYGVSVIAGATHITLGGNNYNGNTTASVSNATASSISFFGGIGFGGAPITVTTCATATAC